MAKHLFVVKIITLEGWYYTVLYKQVKFLLKKQYTVHSFGIYWHMADVITWCRFGQGSIRLAYSGVIQTNNGLQTATSAKKCVQQ